MVKRIYILFFMALVLAAAIADPAYEKEIEQWRQQRVKNLTSEDGWLTLVGLYWLKEGANKLGSDPSSDVLLPVGRAPKSAGKIFLEGGKVRLEVLPEVPIQHNGKPVKSLELKPDDTEDVTTVTLGSVSFFAIKRANRLGIRIKDRENPDRTNFQGLSYFPVDAKWRLAAKFERYNPAKQVPILNIIGFLEDTPSPGAVLFQHGGKSYRLEALEGGKDGKLFLIFSDQTSGKDTYGAGRYLYTDPPGADNTVIVDFNKAYNPPCAFTAFATCPLPPKQNRLALRIEAGEKKYAASTKASH